MQIDQFRLVEAVHEGLYGPVYRGEQTHSQKQVALQILRGVKPLPAVQTLQAHLQTLQKLALPLVPTPDSCGVLSDGSLYLASQWLSGHSLAAQSVAPRHLLQLAQGVAATLDAAHQHGIYHLQLRPSQILVRDGGEAGPRGFVLGLGLYQMLGPPAGTFEPQALAFLAPERRVSTNLQAIRGAADVYSLAILLKKMLGLLDSNASRGRLETELGIGPAAREQLHRLIAAMQDADPTQRPLMSEVNARLYSLIQQRRGGLRGGVPTEVSTIDAITLGRPPESGRPVAPSAPPPGDNDKIDDPLVGQKFGNFRITRRLGKGAMGAVYEARHDLIGHRAAVKVLRRLLTGKNYARRFLDEARAVNIVEHPGLVSIFEFGQREDGLLYIVMEYLSGDSLESLIERRESPFSLREALSISLQAAQALAAAHECGIVHRDIKPSNLMLLRDTLAPDTLRVKIVDFGIAKMSHSELSEPAESAEDKTEAGAMMGTLAYMAPEQYGDAKKVDGKADVFALGAVIYELLTLSSPFGEAHSFSVVGRPPPSLSAVRSGISAPLSNLVARMLLPDPTARPTMGMVISSLRDSLMPRRRNFWTAGLLGIGIVLLIVGIYFASRPRPNLARDMQLRDNAREMARRKLEEVLLSPRQDAQLRAEAALALGLSRDTRYYDLLARQLSDPSPEVSRAAIEAVGELGDRRGAAELRRIVSEGLAKKRSDQRERAAALALFRLHKKLGTPESQRPELSLTEQLLPLLRVQGADSETRRVRMRFVYALYADAQQDRRMELRKELLELLADRGIAAQDRLQIFRQLLAEGSFAGSDVSEILKQLAHETDRPKDSLYAAALLREIGRLDPEAEKQNAQLVRVQVEYQPFAAELNASIIGDMTGCPLLTSLTAADRRSEVERSKSAKGLAACEFSYLAPLIPLLEDGGHTPLPVQLAIACSTVRVLGPPPDQVGPQDGGLRKSLDGLSFEDRLGVIEIAGSLPGEEGTEVLIAGLHDSEPGVRDAAARLLAARPVLQRLGRMKMALLDANTDVQQAGMKTIIWLLAALEHAGQKTSAEDLEPLRERVRTLLAQSQDQAAQAVARALLFWLGDSAQAAPLQHIMKSGIESAKLILIEVLGISDPLLRAALSDGSNKVRFFAAKRLAEAGRRDGVSVLQTMLQRTDESALVSYWLLRRLGIDVVPPRHLNDLLGRASPIYIRMEVIQILAQKADEKSLPLLEQASRDPAAVVRAAVAQAAYDIFRITQQPALLDLLNRLRNDDQPTVRLRAQALLQEIVHQVLHAQDSPAAPTLTPNAVEAGNRPPQPAAEIKTAPGSSDLGAAVDGGASAQAAEGSKPAVTPRPPPHPPISGPTDKEKLDAALQKVRGMATRAQGLAELKRIIETNKQCTNAVCQQAKGELGTQLIDQNDVPAGLGYLKSLWTHPRAATASIPSRQAIFNRFGDRLSYLTIRKPAGSGCAVILDDLYPPGGGIQLPATTPEKFYLRPGEHRTRDCCLPSEQQTETCAALRKGLR